VNARDLDLIKKNPDIRDFLWRNKLVGILLNVIHAEEFDKPPTPISRRCVGELRNKQKERMDMPWDT